jgi:hypothetical protein
MKYIKTFESQTNNFSEISEGLRYHLNECIPLMESVYRIESDAWLNLVNEAREMWERNMIDLEDDDIFLIGTDTGSYDIYEEERVMLDVPYMIWDELDEAEYQGKKVQLNKPRRTPGGPRKFAVYTKNESGKVVQVRFGQPGMRVNNNDPSKAASFRARMRCDNPGPRWKPRWWACNVARYRKLLGIKSNSPW